nr:HAMP domain-containing protein [Gammaproteobacteria bacterium]
MKTLLRRFKRSLTARLLLVFLLTGIVAATAIVAVILHGFATHWRGNVRPHLIQYLDYVNEDIGNPPDLERAKELAGQLPINIYITGPGTDFSSTGEALDQEDLEYFSPTRNLRRRDGRHGQDATRNNARVKFGEHDDRTVLRSTVGDYHVFYELSHQNRKQNRHDTVGRLLLLMLVLLGLMYLLIRRMLRPVQDIQQGVRRMGQGELDYRVPIRSDNDLGELSTSINTMASDIEQMLDAKQQLLLGVSHELRSPITRARIAAQMLEESTNRDRLLDDLAEMETLITEILESERMNSGHAALHREPVDLGALLTTVVDELSLRHFSIEIDPAVASVNLDEARVRLLLRNLLGNAQRHGGDREPPPAVTLEKTGTGIKIVVADNGPGIAAEHLAKVTEPFYRIDA